MDKQAYLKGYLSKLAVDADYGIHRATDQHSGSENTDPLTNMTRETKNDGITRKVQLPIELVKGKGYMNYLKDMDSQENRVSREGLKGEDPIQM